MDPVSKDILLHSLVIFLLLGSVAGLAMGGMLLWRPDRLQVLGGILNRWVSTRHLDGVLERNISVDPWFYRYRHFSALLILCGAAYILYFFAAGLDQQATITGIAKQFGWPPAVAGWMLDAMVLIALSGAVLAGFVSLFLLMRPSQLRDFEQGANHWISLRKAMKPMEIAHGGIDDYVYRNARRAGVLLIAGSLYVLVLLTTWIGH